MSLNYYLDKIIEQTGFTKDQVFDGVSYKKSYNNVEVQKIADNLKVHIIHLLNQTIDLDYLESRQTSGNFNLPERFSKGSFSSTTTLNSILSEFKEYDKYTDILMYLQIHPEVLSEHKGISVLGVHDLLMFLRRYLSDEHLTGIGQRNADAFLKTDFFGDEFFDCLNQMKPAEAFFENAHLIERNWSYDLLKSSNGRVVIETKQTEEMLSYSPDSNYTDYYTNKLRYEFLKRVFERCGFFGQIRQISTPTKFGHFKFEFTYEKNKRVKNILQSYPLLH